MKIKIKILLFLIIIQYQVNVMAQAPVVEWKKSLGGSGQDIPYSIAKTSDGGYIIAGYSNSNNGDVTQNFGSEDYWIVKLSSTGTIQWQKSYGGSSYEYPYDIKQTNDGGYIIAGYTNSNNGDITGFQGITDFWIVKLTTNGTIEWQKTLGGTHIDYARSIQQTIDGGYIVIGETYSNNGDVTGNHGSLDYWVVKLNSTGTIQWQKTLGGSDGDYPTSIKQTTDGGYIAIGYTYSTNGDVTVNQGHDDYWIVKLNSTGTIQWQKTLGGTGHDEAYDVEQTSDGGYIIAGTTESVNGNITTNYGGYDYWIVKLNSTGSLEWQKSVGGYSNEIPNSIKLTQDGGCIIAGWSGSENIIGDFRIIDYWIVKLNSTGNLEWQKSLGGSNYDRATSIQQINDGSYIVTGYAFSNDGDVIGNHGNYDYWIVKLSQDSLSNSTFTNLNLLLYPNPSTSLLNIQTPNDLIIDKIIITDLSGKVILEQTKKTNKINTESLPNGIYLLQVFSGNNKWQSKFIKK